MQNKKIKVAEHVFELSLSDSSPLWARMGQYAPFYVEGEYDTIFALSETEEAFPEDVITILEQDTEPGETVIRLYQTKDNRWIFRMAATNAHPIVAELIADNAFTSGKLHFLSERPSDMLFGLNNALMLMYAFNTISKATLAIHASVIKCEGHAFPFLAKSGTGKSTHSSLWLKHVPGSELLNDDNPIVRVWPDGRVICYGSPWSGKTPCYKNDEAPVGAFVKIRRCTENKISRLAPLYSYIELSQSTSGIRIEERWADGLHSTIEKIVSCVPCYVMDCRPDEEAALVCSAEVLKISK